MNAGTGAALLSRYARLLRRLVQEVTGEDELRPLLLAGNPALVAELRDALVADGAPEALRHAAGLLPQPGELDGASLLVYALDGRPGAEEETCFRLAERRRLPIACVWLEQDAAGTGAVPYVHASHLVRVRPGDDLPLPEIWGVIAERAGDRAWALGRELPVLRRPMCEAIVRRAAKLNGAVSAAVFLPGADLPVLLLNQFRMVARIAAMHGLELSRERLVELAGVVGMGFGLRVVARGLVGVVPGPGWLVKGGVAYSGTRAIGEAAIAYCERGAPLSVRSLLPARAYERV